MRLFIDGKALKAAQQQVATKPQDDHAAADNCSTRSSANRAIAVFDAEVQQEATSRAQEADEVPNESKDVETVVGGVVQAHTH